MPAYVVLPTRLRDISREDFQKVSKSLQKAPEYLELDGPLIKVRIHPALSLLGNLEKEGFAGLALIDTGASMCMVKKTVVQQLKLHPHGKIKITSVTQTEAERNVYAVGIEIGDFRTHRDPIEAVELIDSDHVFDFIIGRNVLKDMIFTYTGFGGIVTLAE